MDKTNRLTRIREWDMRIVGWMASHGLFFTRIAMGVVFIWFGALKPLQLSPAQALVENVTFWIPIPNFVLFLGIWEVVIGVCFLFERTLRAAIILLFLHMPGTLLPFFVLPEQCFVHFPFALTLEGQYIVKNLVLVAAALVIGGTIRLQNQGFFRFAPSEFLQLIQRSQWREAQPGQKLTHEGTADGRVLYLQSGQAQVTRAGETIARLGPQTFIGEMGFLTGEPSSATVITETPVRYLAWPHQDLENLIRDHPGLGQALHASMAMDLVAKLKQSPKDGEDQNRQSTPAPPVASA